MLLNNIGCFTLNDHFTLMMADACTSDGFIVGLHPLIVAEGGMTVIEMTIPYWLDPFDWDSAISFNRNNVKNSGSPDPVLAVKYSERVMELIKSRRS